MPGLAVNFFREIEISLDIFSHSIFALNASSSHLVPEAEPKGFRSIGNQVFSVFDIVVQLVPTEMYSVYLVGAVVQGQHIHLMIRGSWVLITPLFLRGIHRSSGSVRAHHPASWIRILTEYVIYN